MTQGLRRLSISALACLLFLPVPLMASIPWLRPHWMDRLAGGLPVAAWLPVLLLALLVLITWLSLSVVRHNGS